MDAGRLHAVERFQIVGFASGTTPGIGLHGGVVLALSPDAYFRLTATRPMPSLLGSMGVLNAFGHADASFRAVGVDVGVVDLTVHHAFITFDATSGPSFASNPLPLVIVP